MLMDSSTAKCCFSQFLHAFPHTLPNLDLSSLSLTFLLYSRSPKQAWKWLPKLAVKLTNVTRRLSSSRWFSSVSAMDQQLICPVGTVQLIMIESSLSDLCRWTHVTQNISTYTPPLKHTHTHTSTAARFNHEHVQKCTFYKEHQSLSRLKTPWNRAKAVCN